MKLAKTRVLYAMHIYMGITFACVWMYFCVSVFTCMIFIYHLYNIYILLLSPIYYYIHHNVKMVCHTNSNQSTFYGNFDIT